MCLIKNTVKHYYFKHYYIFYVIYSCDGRTEFLAAITLVFSDFMVKKLPWLLSMLKTFVLLNIFVETISPPPPRLFYK